MRPTPSETAPTCRRLASAVAGILALALAATACGGGGAGDDPAAGAERRTAPPSTEATTAPTDPREQQPLVARPAGDVTVVDVPGTDEGARVLPGSTEFGSPLALLVTELGTGAAEGWVRVLVPGRPNGAEAWLETAGVELRAVDHEVRVDLASRTLDLLADGAVVLSTPVAIGDADHPTPTGRFSVTDKLDTGNPGGPYGPFAIGLSARSDVLTEFAGGDGQVGIHGTNDPSSIGEAASHGCVRVPNDVIEVLADVLALGTPVIVS